MATPNYGYEKRQRELAKKKKKEEKLRAKTSGKRDDAPEQSVGGAEGAPDQTGQAGTEGESGAA